ncbi:MAG: LPS assembly lipoprotein LptE [Rhodospirillales bacterium]
MARFLIPTGLLILLSLTAACGFKPLYGSNSGGNVPTLAAIEIAPIEDRLGQMIRNELLDRLTPNGQPANPLYRLTVDAQSTESRFGADVASFRTRANRRIDARFTISEIATGNSVFSQTTYVTSSYDVLSNAFATQVAKENAEARSATILAEDIRAKVAIFLDQRARGLR